ncbi:MAG: DUF6526 family protein, partial [Candidatus Rokuibacteriota bacterium]
MEDLPTAGAFQSYASHRRYLTGWHFFAIPVLGFQAVLALRTLVSLPSLATAGAFVVAVALVVGLVLSRRMALRVQDRLIRLEESLRLQRLLPPERHPE